MSPLIQKNRVLKWQWISFTVIALLNAVVYFPSLFEVPYEAQIHYLGGMSLKKTWWDMAIGSYDFTNLMLDDFLFRPVFYFILGNERFFFGYNFWMWQAVGIVFHLGVVWWLLRLLLAIRLSFLAPLTAGLFSLMFINLAMVVWQNISSYMFFVMLILIALYHSYQYAEKKKYQNWRLVIVFFTLLISSFTYEGGIIYSALIAIYLTAKTYREKKKMSVGFLFFIPLINLIARLSYSLIVSHVYVGQSVKMISTLWKIQTLKNACLAISWWFYFGFFPNQHKLSLSINGIDGMHNGLSPSDVHFFTPLNFFSLPVCAAVLLLISCVITLFYGIKSRLIQCRWGWWFLLLGMILSYTAIVTVGRINIGGLNYILGAHLYYGYMFWIWFLILIYSLVDLEYFDERRVTKAFKLIVGGIIILFSVCNGIMTYQANLARAEVDKPTLVLMRNIKLLIQERGHEPGFSFYVDPDYPGNVSEEFYVQSGGVRKTVRLNLINYLYPQYFNEKNSRYKFINPPQGKSKTPIGFHAG